MRLPVMWDCEPYHFLLWNVEDPPGQRQIGIGESDRDWSEPNKYECRWVSVREWQPDPVERERLLALSKEEVVDRLLRLQATS